MKISSSPNIRNMNENAEMQRGAEGDEDRPQHQRGEDPERQHPLLVLGRHRERGHDDHEDEEVVDRQALLDDVAREVLGAEVPAGDHPEDDAERDRDADVEDRPATASRKPTACGRRVAKRSSASSAAIRPIVAAQASGVTSSISRLLSQASRYVRTGRLCADLQCDSRSADLYPGHQPFR